jgi:hypothetical protein
VCAECGDLRDQSQVDVMQDQAQVLLADYCRTHHCQQVTRFGRLLMLLNLIRGIGKETVLKAFFSSTLGNMSMDSLLSEMLRANTSSH